MGVAVNDLHGSFCFQLKRNKDACFQMIMEKKRQCQALYVASWTMANQVRGKSNEAATIRVSVNAVLWKCVMDKWAMCQCPTLAKTIALLLTDNLG